MSDLERRGWFPAADGTLDGQQLAVFHAGTARPMALLHGLEDRWSTWDSFSEMMTGPYRCYALDLPWRTGGDYRWRRGLDLGKWVDAALSLVPERVSVIVAHSLGANAVLHWLGTRQVHDVDAVVLVSPMFWGASQPADWAAFHNSLAEYRAVMTDGLRASLGKRAESIEPDVFAAMARAMLDRIGPLGFFGLFEWYLTSKTLELDHVQVPVFVVGGTDDPGLAGDRSSTLAERMPAAEIHLDPRLSHFCHAQQANTLADLVTDFLDRHHLSISAEER